MDEMERAFHEAIDDYLERFAETGRDPDRSFSGKLIVRMNPDLHRDVYLEAVRSGTSLNAWITESLESRHELPHRRRGEPGRRFSSLPVRRRLPGTRSHA